MTQAERMRISVERARGLLEPYHQRFRETISEAFEDWRRLPAGFLATQDVRSQRASIWCLMIHHVEAFFGSDPTVAVVRTNQSAFLIIRDAVVVRLKKMDRGGNSSNIVTQTQLDWREQLEIPGVPAELPRIEVGYVPDALETGFVSLLVTHPDGEGVAWVYDIPSADEQGMGAGVDLRITPDLPGTAVRPKRVDQASTPGTGTEDA